MLNKPVDFPSTPTQKNDVNPDVPYHFLNEIEAAADGRLQSINTIFLTSKQCSFDCLMCDLWKNTLDGATPKGAMLKQIDYALARLPEAEGVKLYNSGNFFDQRAVPPEEYRDIAARLTGYERVIVENHPRLCDNRCIHFSELLPGMLEIAMGLETIHPSALSALNKQMTVDDFLHAVEFVTRHGIDVRAFVLVSPPYLTQKDESIAWAVRTVEYALSNGAGCCSIIGTRPGTQRMTMLRERGDFVPPTLAMIEEVFDICLGLKKGRVFVDTWDLSVFSTCPRCLEARARRLHEMNLAQVVYPRIQCNCSS